jgi:predicted nuclease with TOPRIM domain
MNSTLASIDSSPHESEPYLTEFTRLRGEVRQLGEQLDQIEVELRRLLDDLMQQRFEEYR